MYRIHFDPKIGRFIVQVLAFGFIWVSVNKLADSNDKTEPLTFIQFDQATNHVKTIGLDKLYRDKSENQFRIHMNGKGFERMADADGRVMHERFYTGPGVQHG